MKLTSWEKLSKLKETESPWMSENDVSIYFIKLDKEQERLNKIAIKCDDTQKLTQAVDEMYNKK